MTVNRVRTSTSQCLDADGSRCRHRCPDEYVRAFAGRGPFGVAVEIPDNVPGRRLQMAIRSKTTNVRVKKRGRLTPLHPVTPCLRLLGLVQPVNACGMALRQAPLDFDLSLSVIDFIVVLATANLADDQHLVALAQVKAHCRFPQTTTRCHSVRISHSSEFGSSKKWR